MVEDDYCYDDPAVRCFAPGRRTLCDQRFIDDQIRSLGLKVAIGDSSSSSSSSSDDTNIAALLKTLGLDSSSNSGD